jgi:geranylgeranyl diphosphate synthase, type II
MSVPSVSDAIRRFVDDALPRSHEIREIDGLYKMMRDYLSRGGKMIRSKLLVASCLAHGGRFENALPLAAALEMFQDWVLIHDDIEDESEERRGQPALHRLHGVPLALNAGDALHVYMWQVIARAGIAGAFDEFLTMIHCTAEGQQIDLGWIAANRWDITEADYLELVRRKTAHYTVVSPLRLGALAAGREPDPRFTRAGQDLGIAFQIRDDWLNLAGDRSVYGKEIGGDLLEGKRTLMLVHLLNILQGSARADVIAVLSQPRAQKTEAQMDQILALIRSSGSLEYAQEVADLHATRGLALLESALSTLPGREAAGEMLQTARALATRSA